MLLICLEGLVIEFTASKQDHLLGPQFDTTHNSRCVLESNFAQKYSVTKHIAKEMVSFYTVERKSCKDMIKALSPTTSCLNINDISKPLSGDCEIS